MIEDCLLHTENFNVLARGNVNCFDVDGPLLDSWDTGHVRVHGLRPFDGDLLAYGGNPFQATVPSPLGVGGACRFRDADRIRLWDSAIRCDYGSYKGQRIDAEGNCYLLGNNSGVEATREVRYTPAGGEEAPAWLVGTQMRIYNGPWSDNLVEIKNDGFGTWVLTVRQIDGTELWHKSVGFGFNLPEDVALNPDGTVWIGRASGGAFGAERHSAGATLASVSSGAIGAFSPVVLAAMSDNGVVIAGSGSTPQVRRYDEDGVLQWSRASPMVGILTRTYHVLHSTADDQVFGILGAAPLLFTAGSGGGSPQQLDPDSGAVLRTYATTKMGTSLCLFSESGSLWVGGQRS